MKVPFTWKPTGWFMVGWSAEIPTGTVKPLKYFGGHPQITLENAPDTVHFEHVHAATVTPRLLHFEVDGPFYKSVGGFPVPTPDGGERIALKNHSTPCGVGGSHSVFVGSNHHYRLFLSTLWDDFEIWRYQIYIATPAFAQQDARPYGALRKWTKQFYQLDPA